MKRALISAFGSKWSDRDLDVFIIYIDDSGSAPDQKFAIAAGIVFPAKRLMEFEREWRAFLEKEKIPEFHASECLARNPHSAFANWDDGRVERVFARIQQIIFKYSVKAFCIGIHKQDYDEVVPEEMWASVGKSHYVWAVSSVLGLSYDWAISRAVPMEYVFDNAEKAIKRDLREAIDYSEAVHSDHFSGHNSFGRRKDVPGLQAADLFAWSCYQAALHTRFGHPMHPLARKIFDTFWLKNEGQWCVIQSLNREGIELWVKKTHGSPADLKIREFKNARKEARTPKLKGQGN